VQIWTQNIGEQVKNVESNKTSPCERKKMLEFFFLTTRRRRRSYFLPIRIRMVESWERDSGVASSVNFWSKPKHRISCDFAQRSVIFSIQSYPSDRKWRPILLTGTVLFNLLCCTFQRHGGPFHIKLYCWSILLYLFKNKVCCTNW
jgi:hypothetical protein